MRKILKWAAIAFAGWAVFCVAAVLLIYIFAVPDEVKEQQSIESEREAAVRAEEKALEEARKAEEKVAEEAKEAKEEAAKIREVKAKAEKEGFKSMGDWAKAMCGDKNFVKDSLEDEWKEQEVSSHRIDGIGQGWIGTQGDDGRITKSDFPRMYIFTGKGKMKIAGEDIRPLFQNTRQYTWNCKVRSDNITHRGFD